MRDASQLAKFIVDVATGEVPAIVRVHPAAFHHFTQRVVRKAWSNASTAACRIEEVLQSLGSKTPLQAMKDWDTLKPELFRKQPYFLARCDTYRPNRSLHDPPNIR